MLIQRGGYLLQWEQAPPPAHPEGPGCKSIGEMNDAGRESIKRALCIIRGPREGLSTGENTSQSLRGGGSK